MTLSRVWTVVSTNWLREQISTNVQKQASRKLRILDTSFVMDRTADTYNEGYKLGHIPQSVHFNIFKCTPEKPGIKVGFPDENCFTDYVQSLGVWPETHVVAYDRYGPLSAYRTWWQFRAFGHRNISVLDGGLKKWLDDGFEITTEEPEFERSDFVAKLDKNLFRSYEDVLENLKSKKEQLVDARAVDHPSVLDEENGGFIVGSKHVDFKELFTEDGTIKPDSELKALFDGSGVDLGQPMVATCLRGFTACGIAAAAQILGKENVPVYAGSWEEFNLQGPEEYKGKVQQKT
ncbi:thiosulfate sulfurtransferase-like [Mercenaria mercenaria]|uniref:thiosulfate sulfurtransferase-like n=1 Tax=Mercenaria mercenaria TaxID=6596 RepID=UPI00234EFC5A|nr:thiosulfate sulfurtransferase-like [Mercenaria mercenaria]XP_045170630.2 thiosulfate sulfurtransferase-like [Mercenaria mercenaria]